MEIGEAHVKVQRASIGLQQAAGLEMSVNVMSMLAGTVSADLEKSRVLQLMNMVTPEELMDEYEYTGKSYSPNCSQAYPLTVSYL
jgi:splicing factor U2AF subunit